MALAAPLRLPEAVHKVELVQEARRDRHCPVDALATLIEGLEHDCAAGKVDALGRERQGLGDAAAGGVKHAAKRAHRPGGLGRGSEEGPALLGR